MASNSSPVARGRSDSGHAPPVPFQRRRSATQPDDSAAWPGLSVPAALLGFNPSQCCSCPRVPGRLRPGAPTCRFSETAQPGQFLPGAGHRPRTHTTIFCGRPRTSPPRLLGSSPRAIRSCRLSSMAAGRDCLGFRFLSQVFRRRRSGVSDVSLLRTACGTASGPSTLVGLMAVSIRQRRQVSRRAY